MDTDICRCQGVQKVGWTCEDGGHSTSPWMDGPLRVPSWHFSPCPADVTSEQVNKIKDYVYGASSKLFAGSTKCS